MIDSHTPTVSELHPFDCLVLSGGGAKGAFGAGAARAVLAYRILRKTSAADICFLGTSAGALNAAVLAAWDEDGPRRLHALWSSLDAKGLLGATPGKWKTLARLVRRATTHRTNFSVYDANSVRGIVRRALEGLDFDDFQKRKHLVVVAANYTEGRLIRFYSSSLIDVLIEREREEAEREEAKKKVGLRPKLSRFRRITDIDMLVEVLVASAAIPLLFPLVEIAGNWYADGGIGNNTPVQEAALLMRTLNEWSPNLRAGSTFCVLQHPSQTATRVGDRSLWEIAATTYELVHELHLGPILGSWVQINKSVDEHQANLRNFLDAMDNISIADEQREALRDLAQMHLSRLGGHAPRLVLPLHEIRPSGSLGGVLQFDAPQSHDAEGYTAAVDVLINKNLIQPFERETLQSKLLEGIGYGATPAVVPTAGRDGGGGE